MSSGTRSLLLHFLAPGQEPVTLGAEITSEDRAELTPGAAGVRVLVHFWVDEARGVAVSGAAFVLWYGREVGRGNVLEVAEPA